jgi:hypothetical protein
MPDLVRVLLADGRDCNVGRAYAIAHGLEIVDLPTHDISGQAIPPQRSGREAKPKQSIGTLAANKAAPKTPAAPATEKAATPADSTDNRLPKE